MRRAIAVVLGLLGGGLAAVTLGAYVFSTFCWEYCEPEDAPTVWDGLKFALPFGIAAVGLMTTAVTVFTHGRWSWVRSLAIGTGLCVAAGALFWGTVALFA